jgi:hypothetical protein
VGCKLSIRALRTSIDSIFYQLILGPHIITVARLRRTNAIHVQETSGLWVGKRARVTGGIYLHHVLLEMYGRQYVKWKGTLV